MDSDQKVQHNRRIVLTLLEGEDRMIEAMVVKLDKENREELGHKGQGFTIGGRAFCPKNATTIPAKGRYATLSFKLLSQGETLVKAQRVRDRDYQFMLQYLHKLTYNCMTKQEFFDTLPPYLRELDPSLNWMKPLYGPAYMEPKDERFQREKLLASERIDFYAATRMIY